MDECVREWMTGMFFSHFRLGNQNFSLDITYPLHSKLHLLEQNKNFPFFVNNLFSLLDLTTEIQFFLINFTINCTDHWDDDIKGNKKKNFQLKISRPLFCAEFVDASFGSGCTSWNLFQ